VFVQPMEKLDQVTRVQMTSELLSPSARCGSWYTMVGNGEGIHYSNRWRLVSVSYGGTTIVSETVEVRFFALECCELIALSSRNKL
jgi:hypothetical protein